MKLAERRHHQRIVLNQLCTLHFPELFNPVKATIIDLVVERMKKLAAVR